MVTDKVKVRFLRDEEKLDYKKGDVTLMKKNEAEVYLQEGDGLIEIIEEAYYVYKCSDCEAVLTTVDYNKLKCSICFNEKKFKLISYPEGTNPPKELGYNDDKLLKQFLELMHDKKFDDSSELLTEYVLDSEYLYTTKDDLKSEIWIYRDGIYIPQGRSEIKEILRNFLGKFYNSWHYNQVIAKIEPSTFIDYDKFFNNDNKEEVAVMNGILNVKTRELSPFTPKKIFFSKMPVIYDPLAKCDKIDKFLTDILPYDNDKIVFYEIGGFCLYKEYLFEKAFMFVGSGRNGKSKSLELIKRIFGVQNCSAIPLANLQPDNFQISELQNKMINLAGDISGSDLKETGLFKSLTGRDVISAKRKFQRDAVFVNYGKFIFACNTLPMVFDTEKGFWDRWVLLEFPYYFGEQSEIDLLKDKSKAKLRDESIIDKITQPDQLSGLLNAFLDGLERLLKQRKFSTSRGTDEIKDMWIRKSNSFMAFALDNIEEQYDGIIIKKELRKRYSDYCKLHKVASKSDRLIARTLSDMFGANEERTTDADHNTIRMWEGVRWKT